MTDESLPRRDIWLLPLIALLTVIVILVVSEIGARTIYTQHLSDSCKVTDPEMGARFLPNCTSITKAAEGPWVSSHYNALGNRSAPDWTPYPSNAMRVALVGTSIAQGYLLPYEQTAGATIGRDLSAACYVPVEVSNVNVNGFYADRLVRRVHDALALKPQVVLLMFVSHDLLSLTAGASPGAALLDAPPHEPDTVHRLVAFMRSSRAIFVAQHFFVLNPDLYLPIYLNSGDVADFLRVPLNKLWQDRVAAFEHLLEQLAAETNQAGATLVINYVPQEAQTLLVGRHDVLNGVDPRAFDNLVGEVAARHGILYYDSTTDFRMMGNPQDAYYAVDGHVSGEGQTIIGNKVSSMILKNVPAFAKCNKSAVVTAAGKP